MKRFILRKAGQPANNVLYLKTNKDGNLVIPGTTLGQSGKQPAYSQARIPLTNTVTQQSVSLDPSSPYVQKLMNNGTLVQQQQPSTQKTNGVMLAPKVLTPPQQVGAMTDEQIIARVNQLKSDLNKIDPFTIVKPTESIANVSYTRAPNKPITFQVANINNEGQKNADSPAYYLGNSWYQMTPEQKNSLYQEFGLNYDKSATNNMKFVQALRDKLIVPQPQIQPQVQTQSQNQTSQAPFSNTSTQQSTYLDTNSPYVQQQIKNGTLVPQGSGKPLTKKEVKNLIKKEIASALKTKKSNKSNKKITSATRPVTKGARQAGRSNNSVVSATRRASRSAKLSSSSGGAGKKIASGKKTFNQPISFKRVSSSNRIARSGKKPSIR